MKPIAAAALLASLLAPLLGCGRSTSDPRRPLATVSGQLVSTRSQDSSPLRLAVAWYPSFGALAPTAPAGGVVTQPDVTYQGQFPIAFTFSLYDPPPAAAFADLAVNGGTGRIAYGVLLAYQDLDGNGTFDPIPAGAGAFDQVVGLSVADPALPPPARSHYLVYLDGTLGAEDYFSAFALPQGYSLLEARFNYGVEPIPLTGPISIPITATGAVELYACPAAFDSPGFFRAACGIDPYPGRTQSQGNLHFNATSTSLAAFVYDGRGTRGDAAVTFDGGAAAFDTATQAYLGQFPAITGGVHEVGVSVPGQGAETLSLTVPGPPALTTPADGATLLSGAPITIAWTEAADVAYYDVYLFAVEGDGSTRWLFHALTNATTITTPPLAHAGEARLSVRAVGAMAVGAAGSFYTPVSRDARTLTFTR